MKKSYTLETAVIHAGERETSYEGEVTLPIFQSSAYEYNDAQQGDTKYIRRSNLPNHEVLHDSGDSIFGCILYPLVAHHYIHKQMIEKSAALLHPHKMFPFRQHE